MLGLHMVTNYKQLTVKEYLHPMASSGIPPARALLPRVTGSIKTSSRQTLSAENKVSSALKKSYQVINSRT